MDFPLPPPLPIPSIDSSGSSLPRDSIDFPRGSIDYAGNRRRRRLERQGRQLQEQRRELEQLAASFRTKLINHPGLWDAKCVPDLAAHGEFNKFIQGYPSVRQLQPPYEPEDGTFSTWDSPPSQITYSSIGDRGITATVNAYGDMLQLCKYLGAGKSGIFSVDHLFVCEPYEVVARALCLEAAYRRRGLSYGLRFTNFEFEDQPQLKYIHDRWPRFEYKATEFKVSIQWVAHADTILQQCVVTNLGDEMLEMPFSFASDLRIRDLDYLDPQYPFNSEDNNYSILDGPNGYSWVCVHQLQKPKPQQQEPEAPFHQESKPLMTDYVANAAISSPMNEAPKVTGEAESEPDDVVVLVSIFVNGEVLKWNKEGTWDWSLGTMGPNQHILEADEHPPTMEVVTAYRMLLCPRRKTDWTNFLIPASAADVSQILKTASFTSFSLFETDPGSDSVELENSRIPSAMPTNIASSRIEFAVRRNLEHILSVCAIPVAQPAADKGNQTARPTSGKGKDVETAASPCDDIEPIALTCGDISMHRICSSASFFAFQFLIETENRLATMKCRNPYVDSLRARVSRTLRGHLKWLSSQTEKSRSGCFAANYWVTGKVMDDSTSPSAAWTPRDSLTDTPFQLIKAAEFGALYSDLKDQKLAQSIISGVCENWIATLEKLDKRERSAWPHTAEEGINVFRLDDHVWIWKALKSIEDLEIWEQLRGLPGNDEKIDKLSQKFNSREVQRDILRQFTTENDVSRKRMLAVTRSPTKTRFMFHARDTALFYGIDWGFFSQQSSSFEVWENTIEAQAHYDENQEVGWDNSIRYALAIVMGSRGKTINKRSPHNLVRSSLEVLLQSTSPNGFFPGQLDKATKEPAMYMEEVDRDFYFHASFEIPFVLLAHASRINAIQLSEPAQQSDEKPPVAVIHPGLEQTVERLTEEIEALRLKLSQDKLDEAAQPKHHQLSGWRDYQLPALDASSIEIDEFKRLSAANISKLGRKVLAMKKIIPFNSLIDSSSIVEIEEEWLYNFPAFFLRDHEFSSDDVSRQACELLKPDKGDNTGAVIIKGAREYRGNRLAFNTDDTGGVSCVLDALKQKQLGKRSKRASDSRLLACFNSELWQALNAPRTANDAKKRFIWLPQATAETALACYLATAEVEKPAISLFFDRHANYEKFFIDNTTMVLNTWESEFHLSFYQLTDADALSVVPGIPDRNEDVFPGNPKKKITRTSMGFRFYGDFFDRYWTCHFIEYSLGNSLKSPLIYSEKHRSWRQRKVLELHLFEHILTELVKSTRNMFHEIRAELGVENGALSFSILNSDDYFSSSVQWQKFQQILQAVEEELSSVLLAVSKWETREKDRGQEKPRWTRNNERKYRGDINKLLGSTSRKIRDLHSLHANIRSLKESLASSQDKIRDDLGLRGAENIRFFTYVTVVFLPLGFAASIFSMGGTPDTLVIQRMATLAIVALVLTVLALFNAKLLNVIVENVSLRVNSYSRVKMSSSAIVQQYEQRKSDGMKGEQAHEEEVASPVTKEAESKIKGPRNSWGLGQQQQRRRRMPKLDRSWHVWFWIKYVLIELPARRVLLAFYVLRDHKFTWTTCVHIATGAVLLPLFMLSWFFQVSVYNIVDLLISIWGWLGWGFSTAPRQENCDFQARMNDLTYPSKSWRPIKRFYDKLRIKRDGVKSRHEGKSKDKGKENIEGIEGTTATEILREKGNESV